MEWQISELLTAKFENVLSIGTGAFSMFCAKLSNLYIPNVEYIGIGAFVYCANLTSAKYDNLKYLGQAAYLGCLSLKDVNFDKLEMIQEGTFDMCSSLTSICTPNVLSIGAEAFLSCFNLSTLVLSDVNEATELAELTSSTDEGHFNGCPHPVSVIVKNSEVVDKFMEIPKWSEYVQENQVIFVPISDISTRQVLLESVNGARSWYAVNDVGTLFAYTGSWYGDTVQSVFLSNPDLSSPSCLGNFTDTVSQITSFSGYAFKKSVNLSSVKGDGIKNISYGAFNSCSKLTCIDCKNVLQYSNSFWYCNKLSTITIADDNNYITLLDENNLLAKTGIVLINNNDKTVSWISIPLAKNVVLPDDAKTILQGAGEGCTNLSTIIGNGITNINTQALGSSGLTYASFPNLVSLNSMVFLQCGRLTCVNMPNVLTIRNDYATFDYCYSLSTLSVAENNNKFSFVTESNNIEKCGIVMLDNTNKSVLWGSIPCCKEVLIPEDIKKIIDSGMGDCHVMTRLTCDGIETIDSFGIAGCWDLTYVQCKNIKNIGYHAFYCSGASVFSVNMSGIDEPPICDGNPFGQYSQRFEHVDIYVKNQEVVQKFNDNETWKNLIDTGVVHVQVVPPA